jgi:hypothetical protein
MQCAEWNWFVKMYYGISHLVLCSYRCEHRYLEGRQFIFANIYYVFKLFSKVFYKEKVYLLPL